MHIDIIWFAAIVIASFLFGLWLGIWLLKETWLKPAIQKGILETGGDVWRLSRITKRGVKI